jgi:hypothetical protein
MYWLTQADGNIIPECIRARELFATQKQQSQRCEVEIGSTYFLMKE